MFLFYPHQVLIIIVDANIIRENILLLLVNCVWSSFGKWSECSSKCGTGTQIRTRVEQTAALHGGDECDGDATETRVCITNPCAGTWRIYYYTIIIRIQIIIKK